MHELLTKAANYLAVAEAQDSKREAYIRAADAIIAWLREDPSRTHREAGDGISRSPSYVGKLVTWRTNGDPDHLPFGTEAQREARDRYSARRALQENPDLVKQHLIENPEIAREAARESADVGREAGTGSLERGAIEYAERNPAGAADMADTFREAAEDLERRKLQDTSAEHFIIKAIMDLDMAIRAVKAGRIIDANDYMVRVERARARIDSLSMYSQVSSVDWDDVLLQLTKED